MYTIQWKGRIFKAATYDEAVEYAKRITAFEYDGNGNVAIIRSQTVEGVVYVIWIDNNKGFMKWVISGTYLIEEEK